MLLKLVSWVPHFQGPNGPTVRISVTCTSKIEGTFQHKKGILIQIYISTHVIICCQYMILLQNKPASWQPLLIIGKMPHCHRCCPLTMQSPWEHPQSCLCMIMQHILHLIIAKRLRSNATHLRWVFLPFFGKDDHFYFSACKMKWKYQVNNLLTSSFIGKWPCKKKIP